MNIERTDVSERTIQAIVDTEIACSLRCRRERDCGLGRKEAIAVDNDDVICHVGDVICHCHTHPPEFQTDSTVHSQTD
jgi:hypothetical protein